MDTKTVTLEIEGMSCEHCIASVENSLKELTGIISAKATLLENKALVEYDPQQVTIEQMIIATANAGYPAVVE